MQLGPMTIMALAAAFAAGGIAGIALPDRSQDAGAVDTITLNDDAVRRDDDGQDVVVETEDPGDGDATRGNDGTNGGNNTGDGDATRGNDGTNGGNNTGDGDATRGNDGTAGGDNTRAAATGGDSASRGGTT